MHPTMGWSAITHGHRAVCHRGDVSASRAESSRKSLSDAGDKPAPVAHGHGHESPPLDRVVTLWLWSLVAICAVLTVFAVAILWPSGGDSVEDPLLLAGDPVSATVVVNDEVSCSASLLDKCRLIGFEMTDGPYAGEFGAMEQAVDSTLTVGDGIQLDVFEDQSGELVFAFYDFQRSTPMIWLLAIFVVAVIALGRWRGLGAIAGLAFSLGVIVMFTLPAILDGSNAFVVALASASLIAFAALFLAHGFNVATAVSLLSTFASLLATAVLASIFVGATRLTGLSDESSIMLGSLATDIDPRGILLAGVVIGALGVLDDVTVTQVSAVWELKRVQPELTTNELIRPALRIGRDHISSTVNTLFLAYAGAALPLLLLFTSAGQGFGNVVTREIVATEVVRALVGSIGLIASVPVATWLAAVIISPPDTDHGEVPAQ